MVQHKTITQTWYSTRQSNCSTWNSVHRHGTAQDNHTDMVQHKTITLLHMKQCTDMVHYKTITLTWHSTRQSHHSTWNNVHTHGIAQDNHTDMVQHKTITLHHIKWCTKTWYTTRQSHCSTWNNVHRHGTAQDNHTDMVQHKTITLLQIKQCTQTQYSAVLCCTLNTWTQSRATQKQCTQTWYCTRQSPAAPHIWLMIFCATTTKFYYVHM